MNKSDTEVANGTIKIEIPSSAIFKTVAVLLLIIALGLFVRQAIHAISLIVIAFFLSVALNHPVNKIALMLPRSKKGSRKIATAISFVVVILAMAMFLASILPPLFRQTVVLLNSTPELVSSLQDNSTTMGRVVEKYGLKSYIDGVSGSIPNALTGFTGDAVAIMSKVSSGVVSVITVLVLSYMMLVEAQGWRDVFTRLIPSHKLDHWNRLSRDMYKVIQGYVNGQVLLALVASLVLLPLFLVLDVPYPFALVFVVFVCGLIPMIGHTIGAFTVTLVALFTSIWSGIIVFVFYVLYQQLENYAVQPKVQSSTTNMSPLLVFSAVVIGLSLNGVLGAVLSIPIAGCLKVLAVDYLKSKSLLKE